MSNGPGNFYATSYSVKSNANRKIKNKRNERLIKKDIDYFTRNMVEYYISHYGRDSVAVARIQQINAEKPSDPNYPSLIKEASERMQIKMLNSVQKKSLINLS